MTLPGISDAERLEELRDRVNRLKFILEGDEERLYNAQVARDATASALAMAQKNYIEWLEMMAAGVASK